MINNKKIVNIDYIEKLSSLELTKIEKDKFEKRLINVLKDFKQFEYINTDEIETTNHPFKIYNSWEEDKIGSTFTSKEALLNAPKQKKDFFIVPRII